MKKIIFCTLILLITLGISLSSHAESSNTEQDGNMEQMRAKYMKKWQEYATPGEGHKVLEQLAGNWDYSLKYWSSSDAPPEESTGTNNVKWILGNRFLEMDVKGTSMGQPFEGMGILGYDNAKKEYVNTWIDNMGTGVMNATGTYDPETKTLTETGTYTDPMSGQQTFKGVTKFIDADNISYEMYISGSDQPERRVMIIHYTRMK